MNICISSLFGVFYDNQVVHIGKLSKFPGSKVYSAPLKLIESG